MKKIYNTIMSILPSLILIILAFFVRARINTFSQQQLDIILYAPYAILVLGAVVAWRFNRSRIFFTLLIFIISLLVKYYDKEIFLNSNEVYLVISILLPFNIAVFSVFKERGILSFWGMLRFGFIILQIGISYWALNNSQRGILNQINKYSLPINLDFIAISQVAFLIFVITFIILISRYLLYRSTQDASFLGVLIALYGMLSSNKTEDYSVFFTIMGVLLIVAILQDTYFMAFFDELTGLPSRRALNQDLMKLGMKYSIAMLDIDFFKKFNDTYGHDTGDEVLKLIASIIKEVRGGGKAYRYGGEEFTILFPGKNSNEVLPTLEELRDTIAKRGFTVRMHRRAKGNSPKKYSKNTKGRARRGSSNTSNYKKIAIHVSIGVAQKEESRKTPDLVLKAADTALYRAKKKGRNCVSR